MPSDILKKTCTRCGDSKSITLFVKHSASRNGRGSWRLGCFSRYIKERVKKRQGLIDQHKSKPCTDCQRTFSPACMDFDHIRGSKFKDVSSLLTYSPERFTLEIEKCDVVCTCCHRVRSKIGTPSHSRIVAFQAKVAPLKSKPCSDCGQCFPVVAMGFDHVRGVKKYMVSQMHMHSWARVLNEIEKCGLVCANCHRLRTQARKEAA